LAAAEAALHACAALAAATAATAALHSGAAAEAALHACAAAEAALHACAACSAATAAAAAVTLSLRECDTAGEGEREDSNCQFVHRFVPFKLFFVGDRMRNTIAGVLFHSIKNVLFPENLHGKRFFPEKSRDTGQGGTDAVMSRTPVSAGHNEMKNATFYAGFA
jgi:hypothetical protein